uniref:Uncharacterized protein n=1 Tax=Arundo donax TaxID=35708 RepID=A0A0A9DTX2_ARUDO
MAAEAQISSGGSSNWRRASIRCWCPTPPPGSSGSAPPPCAPAPLCSSPASLLHSPPLLCSGGWGSAPSSPHRLRQVCSLPLLCFLHWLASPLLCCSVLLIYAWLLVA